MRRLRPLKLSAIRRELRNSCRLGRAYQLINTHFPAALAQRSALKDDWDDALGAFLRLVDEAGWFEIDWDLLDDLYNMRMELGDDDDDEGEYEMYLSGYLEGVPVKMYGWTDEQMLNMWDTCRWVALLAEALGRDVDNQNNLCDVDELRDFGLWPLLEQADRGEIWFRLENEPYVFLEHGEPLCWLPEIAAMVMGQTDNVLLDSSSDFVDFDPTRWTWANDLDFLRAEYAAARDTVAHFEKFNEWVGHGVDGEQPRLRQMLAALIGGEGDDNDECFG